MLSCLMIYCRSEYFQREIFLDCSQSTKPFIALGSLVRRGDECENQLYVSGMKLEPGSPEAPGEGF